MRIDRSIQQQSNNNKETHPSCAGGRVVANYFGNPLLLYYGATIVTNWSVDVYAGGLDNSIPTDDNHSYS